MQTTVAGRNGSIFDRACSYFAGSATVLLGGIDTMREWLPAQHMTSNAPWTRREFVSTTALGVIGLAAACRPHMLSPNERLAYVGTYTGNDQGSKGIYRLVLNTDSGLLQIDGLAATTTSPSYLARHPNGKTLYAVNEIQEFEKQETGAITAFAIGERGGLSRLDQMASGGKAPCYVSIDRTGRFVLVANYAGPTLTSLPIQADGRVGAVTTTIRHEGTSVHPKRQTMPHPHCIIPDPSNRFVLATDLGIDTVSVYRFGERTGALTEATPPIKAAPGAGPRHMTFHPNGRFLYVLNELGSTLAVYTYDGTTGALVEVQVTPASPGGKAPENHPADVHVSSSGKFLYASNRGDDTIAVFAIEASSGQLAPVQQISTGGSSPRNFVLDPTGGFLLVANQRSNSILSFTIDAESGRLTPTGHKVELGAPVCITFR